MKIELYIGGPKQAAVYAEFLPKFVAAVAEDDAARQEYYASLPPPAPPAVEPDAPAKDKEDAGDRVYGQAGEGRARRTKAEMAEDKEIDDLAAAVGVTALPDDRPAAELLADLKTKAESVKTVDTVEDVEIVDDGTEARTYTHTYTHDDVRDALGRYAAKFGMPEAQKHGPKLMGAAKISAIPDEQDALRAAVEGIEAAING